MPEGLATDLWLAAHIRRAGQSGVPMIIVRKGDPSGAILLKVNRLDGTAELFTQMLMDDALAWLPSGPRKEAEADAALARQMDEDPDLWVVEVEDKQGRLWLPGKILVD